MADNDQLLEKIGNLLDTKLQAEREHNKRIIREEIAVESKRLTGQQALAANHVDVSLNRIENRIKDVEISNTRLEQGQAQANTTLGQIKTAVETVKAGQDDIREQLDKKADKADIQDLKSEVMKKIKKHDDRLDALEEHTGASNPHKN